MKKAYTLFVIMFLTTLVLPVVIYAASPTPVGSVGTISVVGAGTGNYTISTYTAPSTGQNRGLFVIVFAGGNNNNFTDTATWNGTSMAKDVSVAGVLIGGGVVYYLANPAPGNNNLVIHCNTDPGAGIAGLIFTMQDVQQISSRDVTSANANGTGVTTKAHSNITTVNNDVVFGWVLLGSTTPNTTNLASDVGTSLGQAKIPYPTSGNILQLSYIEKAVAGTQNMTFSWTTATNVDFFMASYKYVAPTPVGAAISIINSAVNILKSIINM